jgi:hypothetical protein
MKQGLRRPMATAAPAVRERASDPYLTVSLAEPIVDCALPDASVAYT